MGKRYQIMAIETMMQNTPAITSRKSGEELSDFGFEDVMSFVSISFFQLNQPFIIDIHSPFEYVLC